VLAQKAKEDSEKHRNNDRRYYLHKILLQKGCARNGLRLHAKYRPNQAMYAGQTKHAHLSDLKERIEVWLKDSLD